MTSRSGSRTARRSTSSTRSQSLWHRPRARWLIGLAAAAGVVVMLIVGVFPTGDYLGQRDRIRQAEATLAALRTETAQLEARVAAGTDPVVVERVAREKLGLVREGDRLYRLSVDPADAVELPGDWPLPGVRHLLTGE